jgi:hypothetical protein
VHLRAKSFTTTTLASLLLVAGFGAFVPTHALPDCDANPTAPICGGEPKPKPKPKPKAMGSIAILLGSTQSY